MKLKKGCSIFLAILLCLGMTACVRKAPTVTVASLAVNRMQTEYFVGDAFAGGKLDVTYSDASVRVVDLTTEMLSGFDTATAGTREVTVTYEGKTCRITITVSDFHPTIIPTAPNFDLGAALSDADNWAGRTETNPIVDAEHGFMSFRQNSNNAVAYTTIGMSTGSFACKLKVSVSKDTTAAIIFNSQSATLGGFGYDAGSRLYALEFADDGGSVMYVKKWLNGADVKLTGKAASASVPLAVQATFADLRIVTADEGGALNIKVYVADKLLIDVSDADPIEGGAVGFSYIGTGGMAIGAPDADPDEYVEPPKPKLNIYDSPNVPVAEEDVDLMQDFDAKWTGRADIYTPVADDRGVVFHTAYNTEEPQNGVGEYQGLYRDKIFADVQLEYRFNVISSGEWIMFWFRCVPQRSTDVSVWGNKSTGEKTNGYSMLIEPDGYVQVHKWADGAQTYLNGKGTQLNAQTRAALKNSANEISLRMSIQKVSMGTGDQAVEINEFRIKIGTSDLIVVEDTDTPFLNAGYVGLQGYAINNGSASIRLLSAVAKPEITL